MSVSDKIRIKELEIRENLLVKTIRNAPEWTRTTGLEMGHSFTYRTCTFRCGGHYPDHEPWCPRQDALGEK